MTAGGSDSEAALEAATLALFRDLGWETVDAYDEVFDPAQAAPGCPYLGREHRGQVVLLPRLQEALVRLNPDLPAEVLALAAEELTRGRSTMTPVQANREVYALLRDGVKVAFKDEAGHERLEVVRVVDWDDPTNNDFLLAQQLWVTGDLHTRRPDLVGFVNGLPLLFGELKAHFKKLRHAYEHNLSDYQDTIPHIFWYNAFVILSNGSQAVLGSFAAPWEHFNAWKKINAEGETGVISLETLVRAACVPDRFLDLVENYTLYHEGKHGAEKIVAKNHQYLGVENALQAVRQIRHNQGRLGVFWHTQGSGKSFSMVFLSQKILRKLGGHWTFVIVTDRLDLDDQIYKTFARCGAVTEAEERARAGSGADLQRMLREDHRYIFTLIQKFHAPRGTRYPVISERDDIIVITDEAHRSQYDLLALNMRNALPNAAFIGFTGTPLIAGEEEETRRVFGDYVSIYNFRQSVEDGATVPLYYENRIPELELADEDLNASLERVLEESEVDDAQEERLAREFVREYHLITRDDRLEKIAADVVEHFVGRGFRGKAMVISIDKLTTVKMYDKVQRHWQRKLAELRAQAAAPRRPLSAEEWAALNQTIQYMETTDMAVVASQEQNEIRKFREHGLDILPHRRRMVTEDLDEKFKDADDPFRIAFVCAMWRTGFDAPACSTIYLDRPMRNHTLMQTIARANRVFGEKVNGLIVDYVGIFRELQRALAIYGSGSGGGVRPGEYPIQPKAALVEQLRDAVAAAEAFCTYHAIDVRRILVAGDVYRRIALIDEAVEQVLVNDEDKTRFLDLATSVNRLFEAVLPDTRAGEYLPRHNLFLMLAEKVRAAEAGDEVDLTPVARDFSAVLDDAILARRYVIRDGGPLHDLSKVDFEALREQFEQSHKRTQAERLRGVLNARIERMVRWNRSRTNYQQEFQQLIDEYNQGSSNVETFFRDLVDLAQRLSEEEQRHIAEALSEEELAIFDILTRPDLHLDEAEARQVKQVARELLEKLKHEKLVLDWRKRQQARADVRLKIEELLGHLPARYTAPIYQEKCQAVYTHVYDAYYGGGQSLYAVAG
jgi:type I restriction enzyme R subunit